MAEFMLLPQHVRERGIGATLDAIERGDAEFFVPVWASAGLRFTPRFVHVAHGAHRIGVLTFPEPQEDTEAYLGALVGRGDDPTFLRYFLLEHALDIMQRKPMTIVGEQQESQHMNYGRGPAVTGDLAADARAFVDQVIQLLG
jgi:hypothetical protein